MPAAFVAPNPGEGLCWGQELMAERKRQVLLGSGTLTYGSTVVEREKGKRYL